MSNPVGLDDIKEIIPEKVVYNPQTLSVRVPAGKTLKIETTPDGTEVLSITASNGTDLIADITVSIKDV